MALPVTITGISTAIGPVGPFKSSGGNYYFFGRASSPNTTLQAFKSTAPDTSWASIATKTGFTSSINWISGCQVGDIIHLCVSDGTGPTAVVYKYQTFDMSSDTFVTAETISAAADTRTNAALAAYYSSIVVRSTGEVVVHIQVARISAFAQTAYRRRTGVNTWSAATAVSATGTDCINPLAVLGASDRLHFLWFNNTNTHQRHLTAANVLGTAASTGATTAVLGVSSRDDAGTIRCVGHATASAIYWSSADNPTVTNVALTAGAPARSANTAGVFYALYRNTADSDLYIKTSSDNGATWGTATLAMAGTVALPDSNISKNQSIYTRGAATVFPFVVNDNATLKYNEYTVSVGDVTGTLGATETADSAAFAGSVPLLESLVQKNGGTVLTSASIVTSLPGATTAGNTILIFAQGAGTITTPSGFVSRSPQVQSQGFYLFEKLVASGDATDTPTLTMSGAYTATWQIAEYRNITAFDTSSGNIASGTANGVWNTPVIVPASGNKRIVAFVGGSRSGVAGNTWTGTNPSGWINGFIGQQSDQTNGAPSPASQDALAGGFADYLAAAAGGGFGTGASLINTSGASNPASIIAAYTTTDVPAPPAGPVFRSHTQINYASRTDTTVNAPAGLTDDDILLLSMFFGNSTQGALPTPTWPTGFTEIDSTEVAQGGLAFWGKFRVAWKRASGEGSSYTITHATSSTNVMLAAYSNCIATGSPIDVYSKRWGSAVAGGDAQSNIAIASSVTTTVDNTKLVFSSHDWDGTGALSPPAGMTERYDSLVYVADEDRPSAGVTGSRQHSTGGTNPWSAFLIALKPAVVAGGDVTGDLAATEAADAAAFTGSTPAVTVYTPSPALTLSETNAAMNFRVTVQLSVASNGSLQVRFKAGTGGALNIDGASFGKWDGTAFSSVNHNMTTAPFRLTFAGGSNTTTISANSTVTSDLIAHPGVTLGAGDWVTVVFYVSSGYEAYNLNSSTATSWFKTAGGDQSQTQNPSGYNASGGGQPGDATGKNYSVDLVETNVAVAGDVTGTLEATEASDAAAFVAGIVATGTFAATEGADSAVFSGGIYGTGTLAATEAGDTAALAGAVTWLGTLAATEAADTASMSGGIYATGALATIEASDTASVTGTVRWLATLAAIETADSASFAGGIYGTGTLAATELGDDATFDGGIYATGTLAAIEVGDDATFDGGIYATGSLAATEAPDVFAAVGVVASGLSASLEAIEAADTASVAGTVTGIAGTLAATETSDSAALTATVRWLVTLAATETADDATFNGGIYGTGALAATEAADTAVFNATIVGTGTLAATETADGAAFTGVVYSIVIGSLAAPEAADAAIFNGAVAISGTLAATEAPDSAAMGGTVGELGDYRVAVAWVELEVVFFEIFDFITGTLNAFETADSAAAGFSGNVEWRVTLAASEAADDATFAAQVAWVGALAATEGADDATFAAAIIATGALAASEAADTASFSAAIIAAGALAAIETADDATFDGGIYGTGTLAATEAPDTFAASALVLSGITAVLAATETADDATFAGAVTGVAGTLAASEAPDTANFAGLVRWLTALVVTEAADSANFAGSVAWPAAIGTLVATEGADDATFAASIIATGTLAATETADDATFAAAIVASGTLVASEARDTAAFSAGIVATGILAATEARDAITIFAVVGEGTFAHLAATEVADDATFAGQVTGVVGNLVATEAGDSAAFTATARTLGTLAARETGDASNFTAQLISQGIWYSIEAYDKAAITAGIIATGVLARTETADDATFAAAIIATGTLAATEAADDATFSTAIVSSGPLAARETADDATFAGGIYGTGILAASEAPDSFVANGLVLTPLGATLAATEGPDDATMYVFVTGYIGTLAANEARDTAAILGQSGWRATLAATEAGDSASMSGNLRWLAVLAAIETPDSAAILVDISSSGVLAASEAPDKAAFSVKVRIDGVLAATEVGDTASMAGLLYPPNTLIAFEAADTANFNEGRITQRYGIIAQDDPTPEVIGEKADVIDITVQRTKPLAATGRRNRPLSIVARRNAPTNWDAQA